MDILKLIEEIKDWKGSALLYSGRPDPEWEIEDVPAVNLVKYWASLPKLNYSFETSSALGYKGCCLISDNNLKWYAYKEVVCLYVNDEALESRKDSNRIFEISLISTAPAGVIPSTFVDNEF